MKATETNSLTRKLINIFPKSGKFSFYFLNLGEEKDYNHRRKCGGWVLGLRIEEEVWESNLGHRKVSLWKGRNVSSFVLDKEILPQIALSFENILTNCRKKDKEGHDKFTHNRCDCFFKQITNVSFGVGCWLGVFANRHRYHFRPNTPTPYSKFIMKTISQILVRTGNTPCMA